MTIAAYELEPIGVGGALEAVAAFHFCSESCRETWRAKSVVVTIGGDDPDGYHNGEQCEECGATLPDAEMVQHASDCAMRFHNSSECTCGFVAPEDRE